MLRIEDQCIGCASPGNPCLGARCPRRNTKVYYCNKCGEELDDIYEVDGEDLCEECLKAMFIRRK